MAQNYILRISKDEWEKRVFAGKSYYAGVRREWEKDAKILLVKKTGGGDAFIGYAVISKVAGLDQMDGQEREMCEGNNWNKKLSFGKLVRFEPPVPVRDTAVSSWGQKGALLHGAPISETDLQAIIGAAKTKIVS